MFLIGEELYRLAVTNFFSLCVSKLPFLLYEIRNNLINAINMHKKYSF